MRSQLTLWMRGIWQLRDADLVRWLGEQREHLRRMQRIRAANLTARILDDVLIQGWREGSLALARGVRVEKGTIIALGDDLNGYGVLEIGENTWVGQYNNFRLAGHSHITIGSNCLISQFCSLVAANHRLDRETSMCEVPTDRSKVGIGIGSDVWLGAGVVVLPGTMIADGAVIGANSVVTREVPSYEIWAGVPAKKIGERV